MVEHLIHMDTCSLLTTIRNRGLIRGIHDGIWDSMSKATLRLRIKFRFTRFCHWLRMGVCYNNSNTNDFNAFCGLPFFKVVCF